MAVKIPLKATFTGNDVTGIAEFTTTDVIGVTSGGTGLTSLGSSLQVLRVNAGGTALEYGTVSGGGGGSFIIKDDSSTVDTINDGETLTFTGGTGLTSVVTNNNITFNLDNTAVTPNTYGSTNLIPVFSVDQQGRITGVTNTAITAGGVGTVTSITAGTGLSGGSITSSGTISITNPNIKFSDDTSTIATINLGGSLKISGGTGLSSAISGSTITLDIDNTVTTLTGSQTLTNKTLTLPKINEDATVNATSTEINLIDGSIAGTIVNNKAVIYGSSGEVNATTLQIGGASITATTAEINLIDGGATVGTTAVNSGDGIITNDSGIMRVTNVDTFDTYLSATAKALTNKTISGSNNTITNIGNSSLTNSFIKITDDTSTTSNIPLGQTLKITGAGGATTSLTGNILTITASGGGGGSTLTIKDDANTTDNLDISTDTLTFAGGTGLTSVVTNNTVTFNIDNTVATLSGNEILTNKTINGTNNTLSSIGNNSLTNSSIKFVDDTSTQSNISLGQTLKISGGEAIDTTISGNTITIAAENATSSNKGVATFNTASFDVTVGDVTIKSSGISNSQLAGSITNNKLLNSSINISDDTSSVTSISLGETLKISGDTGITATISGDTINIDLDNTSVNPNTYGSSSQVPVITIDQQGRITSASNSSIATSLTIRDGTSTTDSVNLLTDNLTFLGTSNEIEVSVSNNTVTFGLPNDVTITGNLTVSGTTTNINTTNLLVEDKNIVLGDVTTPSDTTADGGGITLKGLSDKTFNWLDTTDSWTSSEHLNLLSGKDFKINATTVLSSTQVLGKTLPSGTVLGTTDAQVITNKDLTSLTNTFPSIKISDDTSTLSNINLGETLKFSGGTGIDAVVSQDTVTINIDNTVTTNSGSQSLTNKNLTSLTNIFPSIIIADESSSTTNISLGQTLKITGGSGIDTSVNDGTISITRNTLSYSSVKFTGDGSTQGFTINSGRNVDNILVFVNGICLTPTDDYTISTTTLTFILAPTQGAEITIRYLPL